MSKYFIDPVEKYKSAEIKRIREKLNLTQYEFANLMGVSQYTIESWESGRSKPNGSACRLFSMMKNDIDLPVKYNIIQKVINSRGE